MVTLKTADEISLMEYAGEVVAEVLNILKERTKPGMSTYDLEEITLEIMRKRNVKPAFKGYQGYPAALCVSINEEVVHGIPSKNRVINEGDLVSVDTGTIYKGFFGDGAISYIVGKPEDPRKEELLKVTEKARDIGISKALVGNRIGDIGNAIQTYVESHNMSVIKDFVGHGIGRQLHESPQVPNFGEKDKGIELREGMTIAIEPMVSLGSYEVEIEENNWTVVTRDRSCAAHFEHTIAINKDGPRILTHLPL
ncbi:MAG: type I methionyl aminopeptidase [Thermotoga sp.]|nr:type I methionyl aminopeptidase [Thermotogota bacterium]RKX54183.1 MAG: type I methionyl aminopeptidase [Thermotoga sp.]